MLKVKASARPSSIQGIGLFADEKIPKGTITWQFDKRFDILFDPEEVKKMTDLQRDLIGKYAYLSKTTSMYVLSIDDSRFTNHSSKRNNIDIVDLPGEKETVSIANRDIEIGEEILENYREFDIYYASSLEEYLNS